MSSSKVANTSVFVTFILVVGYFISFVKESLIAKYFGVTSDVDAYTIAITVPVTLFSLVSVSVRSIIIPLYSDIYYNQGKEKASAYICNMLTCVGVGAILLICLFELAASPLVSLFAPGFSHDTHAVATTLLRITLPTIFFSILENIMLGVLNVHKKFVAPSLSVYVLNITLIAILIGLNKKYGIVAACIGQVLGGVLATTYLFVLARKVFKYHFSLKYKDEYIVRSFKQSVPIIWSVSIAEVNAIVNRIVASFLFVGSIAALGYASKINSVMMTFFTSAIATIVYPLYSESAAKKNYEQLSSRVNFTLSVYTFFLLPLMVGIFFFREELISVAFARGAFDKEAVSITSSLLGCYCIGILFMAFRETITKVFYSLQDTKTPAKNATIGVVMNIIMNLTLPFILGVQGLALGTSFTAMFISIRLLIQLTKKSEDINVKTYLRNVRGIVLSTSILSVVCFAIKMLLPFNNDIVVLLVGAVVGIITYIGISAVFSKSFFTEMIKMFIKR